MTTTPEVSVIIPVHNGASTLPLQLEALATQIDAPPFEVIVVDNRSTDDLRSVLRRFADTPAFDLRLVEAHEHAGSSYARNAGIHAARAEHLQFCDDDDVVGVSWVRNGHLSSQAEPLWSGQVHLLTPDAFKSTVAAARARFDDRETPWAAPVHKQEGRFPVLMGGAFGGRRSTLLEIGGFDQRFAYFGDDNDLAARAVQHGFSIPVAETVTLAYRGRFLPRERLYRGFHDARGKRLLHTVHGGSSAAPWPLRAARLVVDTATLPLRKRLTADQVMLRWAYLAGDADGALRFSLLNRPPRSQIGEGLAGGEEVTL